MNNQIKLFVIADTILETSFYVKQVTKHFINFIERGEIKKNGFKQIILLNLGKKLIIIGRREGQSKVEKYELES